MRRAKAALPLLLALTVLILAAFVPSTPSIAVEPNEVLTDPVLEARARALSKNIRCLVCQNQSIDSSNASLAKDLRVIVRERLVAGNSDIQILDFLVARYGDYVLLEPPVKPTTYALWYGPGVLMVLGFLAAIMFLARRRKIVRPDPLDAAEAARMAQLMDQDREPTK
ncbi:MAG: cytochrome c-type biogenesis protein CcmH [Proteobacteria bacterium]|nr:cytochrome c-type biogenesis protein CcmH [Pseudomonadota bacterium]MDA1308108.1 cytochrome c-type biogenesis protein CcmH [Pseudomonadota bacterium]